MTMGRGIRVTCPKPGEFKLPALNLSLIGANRDTFTGFRVGYGGYFQNLIRLLLIRWNRCHMVAIHTLTSHDKFYSFGPIYVEAGTVTNNYAHIFDLLTRLRQTKTQTGQDTIWTSLRYLYSAAVISICRIIAMSRKKDISSACGVTTVCGGGEQLWPVKGKLVSTVMVSVENIQRIDHPYLVVYSRTAAGKIESVADASDDEKECGLCHDSIEDPVVASCGHIFCKSCLIDFSASMGRVSCPSCSKPVTVDFSLNVDHGEPNTKTTIKGFKLSSILNRIRLEDFQTSTKIDALREEIRFMVERDGSAKGIVFSQFTSFLDLIHYSLQKSGVNCVQLVGSMTMNARDAAISRFTNDPDCRIFLMSLKAGGVALNLTVASHVFLMDPWWNPAVERQAQDRIHRIGQYKPIRIVRFVIENTVEERILKLQEKKELVFEGTVGGSSDAIGKLTEADLRFLFVT
ncbi:helicase protein with RING/U-box domain-containing protein [Actinidia rufa]|uniref:Helicase protein with RING/U-box domain-containing protein n=1 Tax=Actinidia rufa TaxID=165716 RepID=A0A7J0FH63_9ERIC|nr:helicase protein with RING/U-box domain-containing protein [Actinidia rufa]